MRARQLLQPGEKYPIPFWELVPKLPCILDVDTRIILWHIWAKPLRNEMLMCLRSFEEWTWSWSSKESRQDKPRGVTSRPNNTCNLKSRKVPGDYSASQLFDISPYVILVDKICIIYIHIFNQVQIKSKGCVWCCWWTNSGQPVDKFLGDLSRGHRKWWFSRGNHPPKMPLPSGKLTWQWNITIFNRKYIFKWSIFHCYVSLPECVYIYIDTQLVCYDVLCIRIKGNMLFSCTWGLFFSYFGHWIFGWLLFYLPIYTI